MTTTEERMETLEKQVRRQRRWNIALGVMVVVGGLMAAKGVQEVPDVIQAKKFEVVNDEGKVIVELSNVQGGGVDNGFVLTRNSVGQTLVKLGVTSGGQGLVRTENGKGQTLVILGVNTVGKGLVQTENGKGQTLVQLSSSPVGGKVMCSNATGKGVAGIMAIPDGSGVVVTMDPAGKIAMIPTPAPKPKP